MKRWRYNIGQRFYCDRQITDPGSSRPNFWFVIVGKGSKPDRKMCRLDVDSSSVHSRRIYGHGQTQEYTHKHLQKYGKFVGYEEVEK